MTAFAITHTHTHIHACAHSHNTHTRAHIHTHKTQTHTRTHTAITYLANAGVLVDDGVCDDAVLAHSQGHLSVCQLLGPLGVTLVVVSAHDQRVLCVRVLCVYVCVCQYP